MDRQKDAHEQREGWDDLSGGFTPCFWYVYQQSGKVEDMTRWLKHRAFIHGNGCERLDHNRHIARFHPGNYE